MRTIKMEEMQKMSVSDIETELNDLRKQKTLLKREMDDIDSVFIGYKEELRRRKELEKSNLRS